jgi:hypothetical protein
MKRGGWPVEPGIGCDESDCGDPDIRSCFISSYDGGRSNAGSFGIVNSEGNERPPSPKSQIGLYSGEMKSGGLERIGEEGKKLDEGPWL